MIFWTNFTLHNIKNNATIDIINKTGKEEFNMNRKTALITGSSHGIGKAVAIALAQNGYDVAVNYCNDKAGAEDTCEKARAFGAKAAAFRADVSNYAAMEKMFAWFEEEFGGMDLMVNNAGVSEFHPILEVTEAQFDRINGIDWKGTFFGPSSPRRIWWPISSPVW